MTVTMWLMSIAWSLSMYYRTMKDGRNFDTPVLDYLLLIYSYTNRGINHCRFQTIILLN
jgi:hypothetical protein